MDDKQLNEIEARANAATPGLWGLAGDDEIGLGVEKTSVGYSYDVILAQVTLESDRLDDLVHNPNQFRIKLGTVKADAEFIAHARKDVPALLAEVKRLRAEWDRLNDMRIDQSNRAYEAGADRDRARDIAVALEQENARLQGEVDKWWKATNNTGEALAKINRERGAAQDRANAAEAKLHKVAMLKVWKNEDGKAFVFVDDLYEAVGGGEAL
jgi:hypothetical protein